jgi:hypothetical protein
MAASYNDREDEVLAIDDIVTSMRCVIPAAERKLIDFDPLQVERHR